MLKASTGAQPIKGEPSGRRDSYRVEVAPGQDEALMLAITVCIDQMAAG